MSLQDPYVLANLPRIQDLELGDKVVVSNISSVDSEYVDLGISRTSISSFVLKPSPKLVWSYAVSPMVDVLCMDVFEVDERNKVYACGIRERKSFKILILTRNGENTEKVELKVSGPQAALSFDTTGKYIYVVLQNGHVEVIDMNAEPRLVKSLGSPHSKGKVIYNSFFTNDNNLGKSLLLVEKIKYSFIFKIFILDAEKVSLVNEVRQKSTGDCLFSLNEGLIYSLDLKSCDIKTYNSNSLEILATKNFSPLFDKAPTLSNCTMHVLCPDRILISFGSKIHLINFKFGALLDKYSEADEICCKQAVKVKGNSLKSCSSMAVYLIHNLKTVSTSVKIINIKTSMNRLSECLGKSIHTVCTLPPQFIGIPSLYEDNFVEEAHNLNKELDTLFKKLQELKEKNDIQGWEKVVVPYLKNTSWEQIKRELKNSTFDLEFSVFEVDKDRTVGAAFIRSLVSLILDNPSEFMPEYTLIYLLTHPLFPLDYAQGGLLHIFDSFDKQRLLRQAIITCPKLSLKELVIHLTSETPEILEDVVVRLSSDYSTTEITYTVNEIIQEKQNNFSLESILNNLIRINNKESWILIQCIIDAGGLFNWPLQTINSLLEIVEVKLDSLNESNYYLTLTKQALAINESVRKSYKKKTTGKSALKNKDDIIDSNVELQQQLDSVLSLTNIVPKRLRDESINIARKVSTYSVDKVVI